jgi:DNA repair protein RadC
MARKAGFFFFKEDAMLEGESHKKRSTRENLEVLECLLSYQMPERAGRPRQNAKSLARALRKTFNGFQGVLDAPYSKLLAVEGLDENSAVLLKIVKKSIDLYLEQSLVRRKKISNTNALVNFCKARLNGAGDELFMTVFLNSQNEVLGFEVIQEGTVDHMVVYPRKVMERALHNKASALIFVHNHPSGNCKPSKDDILITEILAQAAQVLDMKVHDHIIISRDGYYSFRERGLI